MEAGSCVWTILNSIGGTPFFSGLVGLEAVVGASSVVVVILSHVLIVSGRVVLGLGADTPPKPVSLQPVALCN